MNTLLKYLLAAVVVVLLGGLFYKNVYIPKTTYSTVSPTKGKIDVEVRGIGNVGAEDIYTITSQSGGKILNILTDEGKWVKKGDLLIEMDGVDLPDQLEIAKASYKRAEYELQASKNELSNQLAQKELIQKTYDRYKKLHEKGFVSQAEYDKALADLQSINAMILVSQSHIDSAKAQLSLSQKSINAIKTKLQYLKVYAPVDGYVISKTAQVAQNVLPTTPILKIVDPKTLWAETMIDERVSSNVKVGQSATIKLSSHKDETYEGIVKKISPVIDAVTLEREIDVAFVKIPIPFYIDEQVEVNVATQTHNNVLKLPLKAIDQQNGQIGVWIVKDMHVYFQFVDKIAQSDDEIAISNLDENMKIVIPDPKKKPLKEGMKINL